MTEGCLDKRERYEENEICSSGLQNPLFPGEGEGSAFAELRGFLHAKKFKCTRTPSWKVVNVIIMMKDGLVFPVRSEEDY